MKKIFIAIIALVVIIGITLSLGKSKKNTNIDSEVSLTKIRVAEVAHTIFYAPWYVALEDGYFEEEGLEIELILTPGADKVAAAVLSGDVEVGFCGPEATIYVYNGGEKDYLQSFAGLTKRDGTFIVSREEMADFKITDLIGTSVIGGRKGGMPEMTFEQALRENGIDPINDLTIDTSIAFAAMQGAFIGGTGDFVTLFEPNATEVERQGLGYVLESVGKLGGEVPYTTFSARKSYIENNSEILEKFTRVINRSLDFIKSATAEEVAEIILSQFPNTSKNDLVSAIERYKDIDAWKNSVAIAESEFDRLQTIMEDANELDVRAPYSDLIETKFFNNAK